MSLRRRRRQIRGEALVTLWLEGGGYIGFFFDMFCSFVIPILLLLSLPIVMLDDIDKSTVITVTCFVSSSRSLRAYVTTSFQTGSTYRWCH